MIVRGEAWRRRSASKSLGGAGERGVGRGSVRSYHSSSKGAEHLSATPSLVLTAAAAPRLGLVSAYRRWDRHDAQAAFKTLRDHDAHPAGVSGVGNLALIVALSSPSRPV